MNHDDPGWGPAVRKALLLAIPIVGWWGRRRLMRTGGLVGLRALFLSFVVTLLFLLLVLTFIHPWGRPRLEGRAGFWALVVTVLGVVANVAAFTFMRRKLSTESATALAGSYRARMFLGIAFASGTALYGFVAAFLVEELWPYLLGLLLSLPAFARAAPTREALDRDQRAVREQGSTLSIREALETPASA